MTSTPTGPTHENERYAAFEGLPCGVVVTDPDHRIEFLNQPLRQLLGYDGAAQPDPRYFLDLLSLGGKLFFETHHQVTMKLEGNVNELTYEMVCTNGDRRPVLINGRTDPAGYVYVVFPSTNRSQYEHDMNVARIKAEEASQAKASFLSSMSHEIRTPLHAILEAGNFLLKDNPREDQLQFIRMLRGAGINLLAVVNDILDISKLESGVATLDPRPTSLLQVARQVEMIYQPQCNRKGIELRTRLSAPKIPLLLIDGGKLTQVLSNLVSNAVKFTDRGHITIGIDFAGGQDRHRVNFTVRDTGMGIPADKLSTIFDPFVQANRTIHAEYGGTGLGLAICQRILNAQGSELRVDSTPGEGTVFSFDLELAEAKNSTAPSDGSRRGTDGELPPLNHLRVLNVDDNRANLLVNARYFSEWNLNFDQFTSGEEVLEALEENTYNVMLVDLRMPDMNGYELARRIRTHTNPAVRDVPLIALSASASREVSAKMLDAGINGLVVKPFEPAYLHHLIQRYGEQSIEQLAPGYTRVATPDHHYDFSEVRKIFAGDQADYRNFLDVVRLDVIEAGETIRVISRNFSAKEFGELRHKMLSTLRVFLLAEMTEQFDQAVTALKAEDRVRFLVIAETLARQLTTFELALEAEIAH